MKFFSRLFKRESNLITNMAGSEPVVSGGEPEVVTGADKALAISSVYRCVNLISESVATLPLVHEVRRGDVYIPVEDELTHILSQEPNEWTSGFDFWKMAVQGKLLFDSSYIVPQYDMFGKLKRLVMARPGTAGPSIGIGMHTINDAEVGLSGTYAEDEVIRIKGMTTDGINCMSVLSYAARTMSISATADRNTLTNFSNGGASLGIITNDSKMPGFGEVQSAALQEAAKRLSSSLNRGDRLVAMGGKWQYIPFTMTAADMQFLESRKFTVLEICRFFSVPPAFAFAETSGNYKSTEMASVDLYRNTVNPILCQIENEITRKLLPGVKGERIRFDREGIYTTDLDSKMKYVEKRIQTGTMTPNEARAYMGMTPVEGGDSPLMSANLKPIKELQSNDKDKEL